MSNLLDDETYLDPDKFIDALVDYLKRVSVRNETALQELYRTQNRAHPASGPSIGAKINAMGDRCHEVNTILGVVQDMRAHRQRLLKDKP